jgi:hypothetical protein
VPRPPVDRKRLAQWCSKRLRSPVARELFETGYLSAVIGIELQDGRRAVLKVRPWADRLVGCGRVHAALYSQGYPCPKPLTAVEKLAGWAISAEALVEDYTQLAPTSDSPARFADALSALIDSAPAFDASALEPAPPWADWEGRDRLGLWPAPDDRPADLNALDRSWIDTVAVTARDFLVSEPSDPVVGHLDWYSANLGWRDRELVAVFDWDSVGAQPVATIAGLAAAVWPATGGPGEEADLQQTEAFLDRFRSTRPGWSDEDDRRAWAAGLWVRSFDAKKAEAVGDPPERVLTKPEAIQRLRLAGLSTDI